MTNLPSRVQPRICAIEFAGAPGSGKTSLESELTGRPDFESLAQIMARSGEHVTDRLLGPLVRHVPLPVGWAQSLVARSNDRHELLTEFLTTHPGLLTSIEGLLATNDEEEFSALALRWFFSMAYQWQLADRTEPDATLVMSEGFAQRALSFIDPSAEPPRAAIQEYLSRVPRPCKLVLLEVDPAEAERRLVADDRYLRNRVRDRSNDERRAFYLGMHRSATSIADVAEELQWSVLRLENTDLTMTTQAVLQAHSRAQCQHR